MRDVGLTPQKIFIKRLNPSPPPAYPVLPNVRLGLPPSQVKSHPNKQDTKANMSSTITKEEIEERMKKPLIQVSELLASSAHMHSRSQLRAAFQQYRLTTPFSTLLPLPTVLGHADGNGARGRGDCNDGSRQAREELRGGIELRQAKSRQKVRLLVALCHRRRLWLRHYLPAQVPAACVLRQGGGSLLQVWIAEPPTGDAG